MPIKLDSINPHTYCWVYEGELSELEGCAVEIHIVNCDTKKKAENAIRGFIELLKQGVEIGK